MTYTPELEDLRPGRRPAANTTPHYDGGGQWPKPWLYKNRRERMWETTEPSKGQRTLLRKMLDWVEDAACKGESWFTMPVHGNVADRELIIESARAICSVCPVITECYEHALAYPEVSGIWAGTTPDQRTELRRANQKRRARGRPPKDAPIPLGTRVCEFPGCGEVAKRWRYCSGHNSQYYNWGEEAMQPINREGTDD